MELEQRIEHDAPTHSHGVSPSSLIHSIIITIITWQLQKSYRSNE